VHELFITYLVASPSGDIPVETDKLDFPLETDERKTPYRTYFQSIEAFLTQGAFKPFLHAASQKVGREISPDERIGILIRAEKHGLLYHPASIEVIAGHEKAKFGLNVAVSDTGKAWLQEEVSVLQHLFSTYHLPYLPEIYFSGELNSMFFVLESWFEGYHEFHITLDEEGKQRLQLWEFGTGYLNLTVEQSFEIYKQAAKILTCYYDFENFNYIYPWHHAAGDFIVKVADKKTDVRLTTARRYNPLLDFQQDSTEPIFALFYFFLHLSLQMRLDKSEGVGDVVWAEDFSIDAAILGFLEALRQKPYFKNSPGRLEEFTDLLRSFSVEELKTSFHPLMDLYSGKKDLPVIEMNLGRHAETLHAAIQTRL
jgi:hypothetical protein